VEKLLVTDAEKKLVRKMKAISLKYFKDEWPEGLEYILWDWVHSVTSPLSDYERYQLWQKHVAARKWPVYTTESQTYIFLSAESWSVEFQKEFPDWSKDK
jgi:hypothetical protein